MEIFLEKLVVQVCEIMYIIVVHSLYAYDAFECLIATKNCLPIIKGLHALTITVLRAREIWNMDRNNGRF